MIRMAFVTYYNQKEIDRQIEQKYEREYEREKKIEEAEERDKKEWEEKRPEREKAKALEDKVMDRYYTSLVYSELAEYREYGYVPDKTMEDEKIEQDYIEFLTEECIREMKEEEEKSNEKGENCGK